MATIIRGKVWLFGDNVNTDLMSPGFSWSLPWEERKKTILHTHQRFVEEARPGDVIVAGRNWGCGSSRENAPANLKRLGLGCVVAESFGRIYFRNSVAIALPNIVCRGVAHGFAEGHELELDLESARVRNLTSGKELQGEPLSEEMLDIIHKGGLIPALKERLGI